MSILDRVKNDVEGLFGGKSIGQESISPGNISAADAKELATPIASGNLPGFPAEVPIDRPSGGIQTMAIPQIAGMPSALPGGLANQLTTRALAINPGLHARSYIAGLHDGAHAYAGMGSQNNPNGSMVSTQGGGLPPALQPAEEQQAENFNG